MIPALLRFLLLAALVCSFGAVLWQRGSLDHGLLFVALVVGFVASEGRYWSLRPL
jgi:hypothetical protein